MRDVAESMECKLACTSDTLPSTGPLKVVAHHLCDSVLPCSMCFIRGQHAATLSIGVHKYLTRHSLALVALATNHFFTTCNKTCGPSNS